MTSAKAEETLASQLPGAFILRISDPDLVLSYNKIINENTKKIKHITFNNSTGNKYLFDGKYKTKEDIYDLITRSDFNYTTKGGEYIKYRLFPTIPERTRSKKEQARAQAQAEAEAQAQTLSGDLDDIARTEIDNGLDELKANSSYKPDLTLEEADKILSEPNISYVIIQNQNEYCIVKKNKGKLEITKLFYDHDQGFRKEGTRTYKYNIKEFI